MKASELTVEMCREKLLEIVKRHPRRKNPRNADGACVYTKGRMHCLIGQMMTEFGIPVPSGPNNTLRAPLAFPDMPHDVKRFVDEIQAVADDPEDRRSWGSMIHNLGTP